MHKEKKNARFSLWILLSASFFNQFRSTPVLCSIFQNDAGAHLDLHSSRPARKRSLLPQRCGCPILPPARRPAHRRIPAQGGKRLHRLLPLCHEFAWLMFRHDRRPNKPLKCSSTAQTLKARSRFSTWSLSPRNVIRLPPSAPLQGRSRRLRARSGRQGMFRHEDLDERNTGRGHRNMPALVLLRSFATARFSNCRLPSAERLPGAGTPAGFGASRWQHPFRGRSGQRRHSLENLECQDHCRHNSAGLQRRILNLARRRSHGDACHSLRRGRTWIHRAIEVSGIPER